MVMRCSLLNYYETCSVLAVEHTIDHHNTTLQQHIPEHNTDIQDTIRKLIEETITSHTKQINAELTVCLQQVQDNELKHKITD